MSSRSVVLVVMLTVLIFVHLGCGTATMFAGTWADPRYQDASIDKLLVIGLFDEPSNRRAFEVQVVQELMKRELEGVPSSDFMSYDEEVNEESLRKHFSDMSIDAVLVSTFAGSETDRYYTPGATYVVPATYQNLYGYYSQGYAYVRDPGYWTETTIVKLETNLYETENARIMWSGLTETQDPSGALDVIRSISPVLISRLAGEGFLGKGSAE